MTTAPANMSAIAASASLQTSLQNFSLLDHHHHPDATTATDDGESSGVFETSSVDSRHMTSDSFTVELNSNSISLPYHWEQCLNLKVQFTGEVYYINWRTGMKAKDDPRMTGDHGYYYTSTTDEDEDEDVDESSSSYSGASGGSSSSSSDSSSAVSSSRKGNSTKKEEQQQQQQLEVVNHNNENENVLVVAGCRRCMMYLMVAKQAEECPKCSAQLLHFHSSIPIIP